MKAFHLAVSGRRILQYAAPCLVCLVLVGCGGGGGSSATTTSTPTPTPTLFTVNATSGSGGTVSPSTVSVSSGQTTSFTLTPNAGYSIDSVTGCGGKLIGSTYTTAAATADCSVTASFVVNYTVSTATIAAGLTPISPAVTSAAASSLSSITADPGGKYVYAVAGGAILQYTQTTNGSLNYVNSYAVGGNNIAIAFDPTGKYAYVVNNTSSGTVSQVTVNANGSLPTTAQTTVSAGSYPSDIIVDPTGKYAYVLDGNNNVYQYTIASDGSLHSNTYAASITLTNTAFHVNLSPNGKNAYVPLINGDVDQFKVDTTHDGELIAMSPASVAAGNVPYSLAMDPNGQYAYVVNASGGNVSQYKVGTNGGLTPMTTATVSAGNSPQNVAVDPNGKFVYVVNNNSNDVYVYAIGAYGELTQFATVATGGGPENIAIASNGKYAYVANFTDKTISQFALDTTGGGALSPTSASVPSGQTATFTVTPDTGYTTQSVRGCNGLLSTNSYTTNSVTANCTVTAYFAK